MDQSEAGHLGKEDLSLGQTVLNNMTQTPLVEYMYVHCDYPWCLWFVILRWLQY